MGSIAADQVLERASVLLLDRTKKRWPDQELLRWLNDGQLAIVQLRPDAYTIMESVQLVAGTRQLLPASGLRLLDVSRNLGTDGKKPGPACRYVDRKQLDMSSPNWHQDKASATVRHWCYDQQTPKTWWCYPPQPEHNQGYVEIDMSAVPRSMTIEGIDGAEETSTIALDDIWLNPLLQFTVYRSFSKDAEYTDPGGKASLAWNEFLQTLGLMTETHARFDPSRNQAPRYDGVPPTGGDGAFGRT